MIAGRAGGDGGIVILSKIFMETAENNHKNLKFPIFALLLLLAVCFAGYWNSLRAPFLYDDKEVIVQSRVLTEPGGWKHLFTREYYERFNERTYRPVASLTFILNYKISHFETAGWHLANLFLHWCVAALAFFVCAIILKNAWAGLVAGLLFAAHPVQTEAVTLVSNREEVLCGLFFFLALWLHLLRSQGSERRGPLFMVLSVASFTLAMFSKEMAATFPIVVILHDAIMLRDKTLSQRLRGALPTALASAAVIGIFLFLRYGPMRNVEGEAAWPGGSFVTAMFTMAKVYFQYVKLLIYPERLCADYVIPISRFFFEPTTLKGAASLLVMLIAAAFSLRRAPAFAFALIFFPAALLPVSNIIPFGAIMAERYLYIPMFAAVLAGGWFFMRLSALKWTRAAIVFSAVGILLVVTSQRNNVWLSDFTLWKNTVMCAPTSARAHANLGNVFFSQSIYDEALREYKLALNYSSPESPIDAVKLPYNMGLACRMTGRPAEAVGWFRRSIGTKPDYLPARYNLATALVEAGRLREGLAEAKETAAGSHDNFRSQYIAGNFSMKYGQERSNLLEAVYYFKRTIKLAPGFAAGYGSLGIAYKRLGDTASALKMLERAAELDTADPLPWLQMAEIYEKLGRAAEAKKCLGEAKNRGVIGIEGKLSK